MKGLRLNRNLFISLLIFITVSCNLRKGEENPIVFKTVTAEDSISVTINSNYVSKQDVSVKYNVDFPESYIDANKTKSLSNLFYSEILGCDSLSLTYDKALEFVLKKELNPYKLADSGDDSNNEEELPSKENFEINIKTVFNMDSILSVCKCKESKIDGDKPHKEHYYYNIDLHNMQMIYLNDLFSDEYLNDLNQMLKDKLLEQNEVSGEDELIQLGYFNLDNLFANNNFFINEKGVTWTFLPLEIGCFSIGETEIFLSYDELSQLIIDNPSVISKYN